jgi:FkbM family methyltransferase
MQSPPVHLFYGAPNRPQVQATARLITKAGDRWTFSDPGLDRPRCTRICGKRDPAPGIVKSITVFAAEDPATPLIAIKPFALPYTVHFTSAAELVSILGRLHEAPGRVGRMHSAFRAAKFSHDLMEEYHEQLLALTFVAPQAKVLELGANVGRNTCVIAALLEDRTRLVSLETNSSYAARAQDNLARCGLAGPRIVAAALSEVPLQQSSWRTKPMRPGQTKPDPKCFVVNTLTHQQLTQTHGSFDTLVADCEGALLPILTGAPQLLDTVHTIITENDYIDIKDYQRVAAIFAARGFRRALHMPNEDIRFPTKPNFYEAWVR